MRNDNQSTNIVTLDSSLESLKARFNGDREKIRFLTLLSPTCPLGRDKGARAVHENVFEKYPNADIRGYIVWINMLPGDSIEAILPSLKILKDERIEHFYDPKQRSGKEIAMSVGWEGRVAWDIYLFYPQNIKWPDIPPRPVSWMHQISDEWAKNEHYHTGDQLARELDLALKKLIEK